MMDDAPLLIDTGADAAAEHQNTPGSVPITIVTGYLGSGKSTMLQHLIQHNAGKKIAIILNEFGDTSDIERSLTVSQDDTEVEEWLELDNGCLCCTAKDAGVSAIEKLMERKGKFDYIILETTGIADPAPIAAMFWLDDALVSSLRLDGVVTVVDAANIIRSIATGTTAAVQIATADVIVINKVDTVTEEELESVRRAVSAINSAARVVESNYGTVPTEDILDLRAYHEVDLGNVTSLTTRARHDSDISTKCIPLDLADDQAVQEVERRLQLLLWEHNFKGRPIEIHRAKGKLITPTSTKILQGVRETYEMVDVPQETGQSKIVLVGRGVSSMAAELDEYFQAPR